jgi:hypothetical protein
LVNKVVIDYTKFTPLKFYCISLPRVGTGVLSLLPTVNSLKG